MSESVHLWEEHTPSVLPFVGAGFAIVGYTLTIITYCLFGSLRGNQRQLNGTVIMNLSFSLLLLNISFIMAALRTRFNHSTICDWISLSMHYFILTSLLWFVADAVFLFHQLSTLIHSRNNSAANANGHLINGILISTNSNTTAAANANSQTANRISSSQSDICLASRSFKYFLIAWITPFLVIGPVLVLNGQLFEIGDIYCRITDRSENIVYYLSLAVPSAIIVLIGLCVYLFVILWIYCFKHCCNSQTVNDTCDTGRVGGQYITHNSNNLSSAANNCNQQLIPTPHTTTATNCTAYVYNMSGFKQHVVSMTVLLALFAATWLCAQSLDLQTFDFVFCFANVTQSWLFFSEKCILISEARNAWKRFFSNSDENTLKAATSQDKFSDKNTAPSNHIRVESPTNSLVSTIKETGLIEKRALLTDSLNSSSLQQNRNHTGSRHSVVSNKIDRTNSPLSGTAILNSASTPFEMSQKYNSSKGVYSSSMEGGSLHSKATLKETAIIENGKFQPVRPSVYKNNTGGSYLMPNDSAESLSIFTGFASSDPTFIGQNYSPAFNKDCRESGDPYGATYLQSAAFDSADSPSVADSDPNRESYV